MSIKDCIDAAVAQGAMTYEEGQRLKARYDKIAKTTFSYMAGRDRFLEELEREAFQKQRVARLMEGIRIARHGDIEGYTDHKGRHQPHHAILYLLENEGQARFQDVETRRRVLMGLAHARLERLLHEGIGKYKLRGDLGRRMEAAKMENVIRELYGVDTGDKTAKALAEAWAEVAEDLRLQYNAAGGNIGKLKLWIAPQHHDRIAVGNVPKAKWIEDVMPRLNRDEMVDDLTGRPLSDDELRDALDNVYDAILTDGWSRRDPSMAPTGKGALHRQRADHRFLIFKDADAWLEYQKDYGSGDPFATMMAHISTMTRDIAFMQILGPNPHAMYNYLKQVALKHAMNDPTGKMQRQYQRWTHTTDAMFDNMRGNGNLDNWLSHTGNFLRNMTVATTLGSASISALSDPSYQKATRIAAGMGSRSGWGSIMAGYARQLARGGQQMAVRAGLILDSAVHTMHKQARYSASTDFVGVSGYIADRTLALTWLTPFTQAGKHAFGLDLMAHTLDTINTPWKHLNPDWRRTLIENGLTEADWARLRSVQPSTEGGLTVIRPHDVEAVDPDLALRYAGMIHRLVRRAVPEPGVRARTAMLGGSKGGTEFGEFARLAMQFKGFSVGIVFLHILPLYRELIGGRWKSAAVRGSALAINMMLLGALAMHLKDMVNGRDPRDMSDPEFWGAAMLQGGGLGIFGDLLFSDVNRFGGGLPDLLAGPVIGKTIDPARNLIWGNAIEGAKGEDTNIGREATRFIGQNTPFLSSAWYARLAYDRIFIDQMRRLVDPGAQKAFRRTERFFERERDQQFWWGEGEVAPERAPDLSRAFGQ